MSDTTPEKTKQSWWRRLSSGLKRTSSSLGTAVADLVTKRKLDRAMLEDIEDVLLRADLGTEVAARIAAAVGTGRYDKAISADDVKSVVATEVEKVLGPVAKPLQIDAAQKPFVILVVGVNGSGKTTTIGKLAAKLSAEGRKVMLAAGDTFRAAAIEQLKVWGERTKSPVIAAARGAVEFCHDETRDSCGTMKRLDLRQRILSHSRVEHQQHGVRRRRVDLLDDANHLFELVHQLRFVLQAARGVDQQHIEFAFARRRYRVEG